MILQYIIVAVILAGAIAFLVRRYMRPRSERCACCKCPVYKAATEPQTKPTKPPIAPSTR